MSIDIHLAYKFVLEELKLRNVKEVEWFKSVPLPLKSLVYFSDYKKKDYVELSAFLDSEYRG